MRGGERSPDGPVSISFRCKFDPFRLERAFKSAPGASGEARRPAGSDFVRPPSDRGLCRKVSDIVKRKRIRLPDVGRRKSGDGSYPFSVLRPLSSVKQPVVGLEPDRSDPRMRLKQNWSFQRQAPAGDRSVISDRNDSDHRSRDADHRMRALAMRAIKCLKGIWWMPWR
jgi:hypothetical protein